MVSLALAAWWIFTLEIEKSWAWDESMHAELPAVRMMLSLGQGDLGGFFDVLHACVQYPFGWPLVLAAVQSVFGVSEFVCRATGLVAWAGVCLGVFMLAVEIVRLGRDAGREPSAADGLFPWLALVFCALSPLGLGYGQSLFLEVPFTLCAVFALRAWLRCSVDPQSRAWRRRQLVAGAWLAAAFFVKFNYGLLLMFGCGLDALAGLVIAWRAGRARGELGRLLLVAAPVALALLWWLVLPLPFGAARAALHRDALFSFLGSNQEMASTPFEQRVVFWTVFLSYTTRLFVLQVVGVVVALRSSLRPGPRLLWLVFLGSGLPVWTHNFHLDRFLVPGAPLFWTLAALGLAGLIPAERARRAAVLAGLALVALLWPSFDGPWVGERLGLLPEDPAGRAYVTDILEHKHELGAGRRFWTPGLAPESTGAILEHICAEVGEEERVGWIGNPTEIPPAVVHLALLESSGNRARFLRDAHLPLDVTFTGADPHWTDEQLRKFVARFDVVISTDPPDVGGRAVRAFIRNYSAKLVERLGWRPERIGQVRIPKDLGPDMELWIYALRPPKGGQ